MNPSTSTTFLRNNYVPDDFEDDRIFYFEVDPHSILHEIPSLFYRRYKDQLGQRVVFIDQNDNQVELTLSKGNSSGYILGGFDTLVRFYDLTDGGWMKLMYIGENVFIVLKVKDADMEKKELPYPPVKLFLDAKPSDDGDHNANQLPRE